MSGRLVGAFLASCLLVSALGCEYLPYLSNAGPVIEGGRVERPAEGFAVAFPDDWTIREVSPEGNEGPTSALHPEMSSLLSAVVAGTPPTMHDRCVVVDLTQLVCSRLDWASLDDVVAGFMLLLRSDPRWVDLESTFMDLRAGRTGRILRAVDSEAEYVSTYYFTDSDAWFYLECVSPDPSLERWLSIAESFEFLPADE